MAHFLLSKLGRSIRFGIPIGQIIG